MSVATIHGDGWTMTAVAHGEWVDSFGPSLDPDWKYTDRAGHEHHGMTLLVEVQDDPEDPPFMFDEDGEEYNAPTHLECELCGEHIRPGVKYLGPQWIATYTECTVTITTATTRALYSISRDLAERIAVGGLDVPATVQAEGHLLQQDFSSIGVWS